MKAKPSKDDLITEIDHLLSGEWLAFRTVFQPVFMGGLCAGAGIADCLTLSDSGSSIAFAKEEFLKSVGISPYGVWEGVVITMYSENAVKTNFFKLAIKLRTGDNRNIFALGINSIGSRPRIPDNIVHQVAQMFNVDPSMI